MSYASRQDIYSYVPCVDSPDDAAAYLEMASEYIDTLTFRRIPARGGLAALSEFQRETVTECCARLAVWLADYADTLDGPLTGYSINGVSARYGTSGGMASRCGVILPRSIYALLEQTGLCCEVLA